MALFKALHFATRTATKLLIRRGLRFYHISKKFLSVLNQILVKTEGEREMWQQFGRCETA